MVVLFSTFCHCCSRPGVHYHHLLLFSRITPLFLLLLVTGCKGIPGGPGETAWVTEPVGVNGDYALPFSFGPDTTYSPTTAGTCPTSLNGECQLFQPNPGSSATGGSSGGGEGTVCDCQEKKPAWKRLEITESEYNRLSGGTASSGSGDDDDADDDLSGIGTSSSSGGERCSRDSFGWTWDVSADDTIDIVMTIPPGEKREVWLGDDDREYLGTDATVRGMPCGTIFQDVFQGTPVDNGNSGSGSSTPHLLPSTVPSSLYCELNGEPGGSGQTRSTEEVAGSREENPRLQTGGRAAEEPVAGIGAGSTWKSGWSGLSMASLTAIDSVCRCAMTRIPAMLEMSGVYFLNSDYGSGVMAGYLSGANITDAATLTTRSGEVKSKTGWLEAAAYFNPNVFYCREDYVLYWNLLLSFRAIYGSSNSLLRECFVTQNGNTMATSTGDDSRLYWIRFLLLGVDCLGGIQTAESDKRCQSAASYEKIPFLPNVSVGLDIGQFFRGLDLPGVLYGEDGVAGGDAYLASRVDDEDGRVRDYLWAFASLRRRDPSNAPHGCVQDFYYSESYGFCANRTFFDNFTGTISNNGGLYSLSVPNEWTPAVWPDATALSKGHYPGGTSANNPLPSANLYEFAMETTSLFVRMMSLTTVGTAPWSVESAYSDNMEETFWEIPTAAWPGGASFENGTNRDDGENSYYGTSAYGDECAWWMLSGETRVGPDAVMATTASSCSSTHPEDNFVGCPGVSVTTPVYDRTLPNKTGTVYGYCCEGQTAITDNWRCNDDGGSGGQCGSCCLGNDCATSWITCKDPTTNCGTRGHNSQAQRNPWVCLGCIIDTNTNQDIRCCLHGEYLGTQGDVRNGCPSEKDTCTGPSTVPQFNVAFVGGYYSPVYGHPRYRGMAPRGLYKSPGSQSATGGGEYVSTTCGTTAAAYYLSSTQSNACFLTYPRPAVASIFAEGSAFPENGDYRTVYFDPDYSTFFTHFTDRVYSGDIPISDAEQRSTFFPFWTPPAFTSSSGWVYPNNGEKEPELAGRTMFEGSGAMFGHFFDAPTTLDIAIWCEVQEAIVGAPTFAPTAGTTQNGATFPPTAAPTVTASTPVPAPTAKYMIPEICGGLSPVPEIEAGMVLTMPQYSTRFLTVSQLTSLQGTVGGNLSNDATVAILSGGLVDDTLPTIRPSSFGGMLVGWYNAIRLRWKGGVAEWANAYFWKGSFPKDEGITEYGGIRLERISGAIVAPGWLPAPDGGGGIFYDVGTSALLQIYLSMTWKPTLPEGWVLVDTITAPYGPPTTIGEMVRLVVKEATESGRNTEPYTSALAGYYRELNQSGCGTYDGTEYCLSGCGAWRPGREVPFWLWSRWCGPTGAISFGWGVYRALIEQVLRPAASDSSRGTSEAHGFDTRSGTAGGSVYGSFEALSSTRFYTDDTISVLSLKGSAWCWESGRGIVGDTQASLTGLCSASWPGDICYMYMSSGGTSTGAEIGAVTRSGCLPNTTFFGGVNGWTEVETTTAYAPSRTIPKSGPTPSSATEIGDGSMVINWTKPLSGGSTSGKKTTLLRCFTSTTSGSPLYGNGATMERACMVGATVVGFGNTTGTTGNGYGGTDPLVVPANPVSDAAKSAVWVPRNVLSSNNVAPYGELGGKIDGILAGTSFPAGIGTSSSGPGGGLRRAGRVMQRICGCGDVTGTNGPGGDPLDTVDWPWQVCRSNVDGYCVPISGNSGTCPGSTDFNCGTMYGWINDTSVGGDTFLSGSFLTSKNLNSTKFLHLCSGCTSVLSSATRLSVGQCKDSYGNCAGVDTSGACPSSGGPWTLCVDNVVQDTVYAAGVPPVFVDSVAGTPSPETTFAEAISQNGGAAAYVFTGTDPIIVGGAGYGATYDLFGVIHDPLTGVSVTPTAAPTSAPTGTVTPGPTVTPTTSPTDVPTTSPTDAPVDTPTAAPTLSPTDIPTDLPTKAPTESPTDTPSATPTAVPTYTPTDYPTYSPSAAPTNTDSVFLRVRRWIPDSFGQQRFVATSSDSTPVGVPMSTYDAVNCVGVYSKTGSPPGENAVDESGPASSWWYGVVENPSYLSTDVPPSPGGDFPGGLTEEALEAWCQAETNGCVGVGNARRWVCVDVGQTTVPPKAPTTSSSTTSSSTTGGNGRCILRRVWRDEYTAYTDASGQARGTYSGGSARAEVMPDCYSWVSGLDADWDCQRPDVFTGCVITETAQHHATSVSNGDTGTYGYSMQWVRVNTAAAGLTELYNDTTITTVDACVSRCRTNTSCTLWWWYSSTVCLGYDSRAGASDEVVISASDTDVPSVVGTVLWAASAGYEAPRTHAGPVLTPPVATGQNAHLYLVHGADFYVHETTTPGGEATVGDTTAPFGTYGCAASTIGTPAPSSSSSSSTAAPTPAGFPDNGTSVTCGRPGGTPSTSTSIATKTVFGWLTYYGYAAGTDPDTSTTDVVGVHRVFMTVNTSATLLSRTTILNEYSTANHRWAPAGWVPQMLRVTLDTPVWMLGVLEVSPTNGFESTVYSTDEVSNTSTLFRGRGLRGVWRGTVPGDDSGETVSIETDLAGGSRTLMASLAREAPTESAQKRTVGLTLARWRYTDPATSNVTTFLPTTLASVVRRTCVPLTLRKGVDSTTFSDRVTNYEVYRRDPVDCIVAGSVDGDTDINTGLFGRNGVCSGTQRLNYPSGISANDATDATILGIDDDAGYVTNLRYYSRWFWAMYGTSGIDAPHFYDPTVPQAADAAVSGVSVSGTLRQSLLPGAPSRASILTAVPNCRQDGGGVDGCNVAFDITGYVPCTGEVSTVWFTCMKPTMNALFPLYPADFSVEPTTPFYFPVSLYVKDPTVDSLSETSEWMLMNATQFFPMVHYCDRYAASPGDTVDGSTNGWKPGRFIECANDPLSASERNAFCRDEQPWWVLVGRRYTSFSFQDLCPFTGTLSGAAASKHCFVFADHPEFPTVSALLSAEIPGNVEWEGTTFYYVPFTLQALGQLLLDMRVVNTLLTNSMFGEGIDVTDTNYTTFGPSIALFARYMVSLIGSNTTRGEVINNMCDITKTLQPETFQLLYTVIQQYYDAGTNTYTFTSTAASSTTSKVTLTATEVIPVFQESSTVIEYDGVTLTSVVDDTKVTIGTGGGAVVNEVKVCTRFQINGRDVVVKNLRFDQSKCVYTGVLRQTPIVFSGSFAQRAEVTEITVIDSSAAVAVVGGDSLIYRYESTIETDGMLLHNIGFEYTSSSTIPISEQRVVAVFSRSVGVPVITDCTNSGTLPSGLDGGNYARTQNCLAELIPYAVTSECGFPDECAVDTAVSGSNGCCGPPLQQPIPYPDCEFGLLCVGNMTQINATIATQPNSRVLCTSERCGCTTRYASSTECVSMEGVSRCFYEREMCYPYCGTFSDGGGGTGTHRQHYTLGAGMVLAPLRTETSQTILTTTEPTFYQDWQYGAGDTSAAAGIGSGWYPIRDKYYNQADGESVSYVRGVGYGQYVWTVRRSSCDVNISDLLLPSELVVEARLLPVTSEQTDTLDTITIIPAAGSGSSDGIYASTMKLVLFTDWFFDEVDTSLFQGTFLNSLRDTLRWCVGVNTTTGDLGVFDCLASPFPTELETEWFFDGITTRVHLSGHPFMCATLFTTGGRYGCPGNGSGTGDVNWNISGSATNVSYERGFAGQAWRPSNKSESGGGGRLEWTPCAPCTIGTERILIGMENESGVGATVHNEHDSSSPFYATTRVTQLLHVYGGTLYAVFGSVEEEVVGVDLGLYAQGRGFVVVATPDGNDASRWYGYVLDDDKTCLTVTSVRNNNETGGTTTHALAWRGCIPEYMFPGGGGIVTGCTNNESAFSVGVFQYICTRGYGGQLHAVDPVTNDCTLATGGILTASDGIGFGGTVAVYDNGSFYVVNRGFGYLDGDVVTSGSCTFTVDTSEVLIQPVYDTGAFDIGASGVQVVNVTEYIGYTGTLFGTEIDSDEYNYNDLWDAGLVAIYAYDAAILLLLFGLTFYRAEIIVRATERLQQNIQD